MSLGSTYNLAHELQLSVSELETSRSGQFCFTLIAPVTNSYVTLI